MEATLKSAPRFLIAKYAPDMRLMEPRNIGVILWSSGDVAARFIGESDEGTVIPPTFITRKNKPIYLQWVRHWRKALAKKSIEGSGDSIVRRSSPDFLAAFRARLARENYMLVEGGVMFESIARDDMQDAANQLFSTFISTKDTEAHEQASILLRHGWSNVIRMAALKDRSDFHKPYGVRCNIEGVSRTMKWDNGIGNGVPEALFQRTLLRRDESVNSTFAMLEAVTVKQPILSRDRCAAIIYATPEDLEDESVASSIDYLGLHGTVLNTAIPEQAAEEVLKMKLPPPHNAA